MLVLYETAAGFALFKVLDESKLADASSIQDAFSSPESASSVVKLKAFRKFENAQEAMQASTALVESKVSKPLKKFLKKEVLKKKKEELAVIDKILGSAIKEKLEIPCLFDSSVFELMRGIRSQIGALLGDVATEKDLSTMALGLAHSLSRYKLKFSPDKVDTMIVQAISLLDDLDKELNIYAMRVKEWYGWHFPELGKIVPDNQLYAKTAIKLQNRNNAAHVDLTDVLPEELAREVKDAAIISMGTEISENDLLHVCQLAQEVTGISEYRTQLFDYLKNRMQAIAPNLTHLVGELVGARLIAHAGSLLSLAKHPASTVQILGAEKALFRALKSKHNTPKYGLIYHASLIGQTPAKHKGKVARVLAAKCAISARVDALGEKDHATIGIDSRDKVENRIRILDGVAARGLSAKPKGQIQQGNRNAKAPATFKSSSSQKYNAEADVTEAAPAEEEPQQQEEAVEEATKKKRTPEEKEERRKKKEEKKRKREATEDGEEEAPKKKKKKVQAEDDE